MYTQNGIVYVIVIVIVVAMISALTVISLAVRKSGRARLASQTRAEHEEQTRIMTSRLADTGTEWRVLQDDANGKPDTDDPVDQSIEAQFSKST